MKNLFSRVYRDYFMFSKLKYYRKILNMLESNGYKFITVEDYFLNYQNADNEKLVVLRHDIDSDIKLTYKMLDIESKVSNKIKSTYYFRWSTISKSIVDDFNKINPKNELSYHFEEISDYCKKFGFYSKEQVDDNLQIIQKMFEENTNKFRNLYNVKCLTVASHGDFVNRKLSIINNYLLDVETRKKLKIIGEAYDSSLKGKLKYYSDAECILYSKDVISLITESIKRNENIYILVHPRNWSSAPLTRFKLDLKRLQEGRKYNGQIKKNIKNSKRNM